MTSDKKEELEWQSTNAKREAESGENEEDENNVFYAAKESVRNNRIHQF